MEAIRRYFSPYKFPYCIFPNFEEKFGGKICKFPIDAGLGCPHRQNGKVGCIFCNEVSFVPSYSSKEHYRTDSDCCV